MDTVYSGVIVIFSNSKEFPHKGAVIIDGGYWRAGLEDLKIKTVDLVRLTDLIATPAYRVRTLFFDGKRQENQSFHDSLRLLQRFDVFLGDVVERPYHCRNCNTTGMVPTQKRVDVALAVELVHLASTQQVDVITVIAGDMDFLPAIETAKHEGSIIRLVYFNKTVNDNLLKAVDERIEMNRDFLIANKIDHLYEGPEEKKEEEPINQSVAIDPEEFTKEIKRIYLNTKQKEVSLSIIGQDLNKKFSNWKESFDNKQLKDVIQELTTEFIIEKRESQYYMQMKITDVVVEKNDKFEKFLKLNFER